MLARTVLALIAAILVAVAPVPAQQPGEPWVPLEFLDRTRPVNDDEIVFCLNTSSALVEMDREVGQAIADTLLLNVRFHEVVSPFDDDPYDFRIQLSARDLYVTINNNCQGFIGMRLSAGQTPEWMTVSAPYYVSRSVFAGPDPAIAGFGDIGPGVMIGSRLGSPGDSQLTAYLRSLPENQRPRRIPYPDNGLLLERLADGSVSLIYIWEPALHLAADGDPATLGIATTFPPPYAVPAVEFGIAFLSPDTFLRGLVDEAIAALRADGTLAEIVARHALPADRRG